MSINFQQVPVERFHAFHESFNGEGNGIWGVCAQCGGRCEIHKIGTLMPGEKEFIASYLGLPIEQFEAQYLDRLITPRGTVDVLKLVNGCPFLNSSYHCVLADKSIKPVLCEVYPVVFEVEGVEKPEEESDLKVKFLVDEIDCPLMHATFHWRGRNIQNRNWQQYRHYFETTGIELLSQVQAPASWYRAVAQYDSENFDYKALESIRELPRDQYATFTLDQLMSCSIGHDL